MNLNWEDKYPIIRHTHAHTQKPKHTNYSSRFDFYFFFSPLWTSVNLFLSATGMRWIKHQGHAKPQMNPIAHQEKPSVPTSKGSKKPSALWETRDVFWSLALWIFFAVFIVFGLFCINKSEQLFLYFFIYWCVCLFSHRKWVLFTIPVRLCRAEFSSFQSSPIKKEKFKCEKKRIRENYMKKCIIAAGRRKTPSTSRSLSTDFLLYALVVNHLPLFNGPCSPFWLCIHSLPSLYPVPGELVLDFGFPVCFLICLTLDIPVCHRSDLDSAWLRWRLMFWPC